MTDTAMGRHDRPSLQRRHLRHSSRRVLAAATAVAASAALLTAAPPSASAKDVAKTSSSKTSPSKTSSSKNSSSKNMGSTARGTGGAVSSVDVDASRIGRDVLARGGNAADAAVAMASALGVSEPYSAGIGGGGYFVYFDAKTKKVSTIDGRETAPAGITADAFVDPSTGKPYPFTPQLVSSGVAVGVPGTVATWDMALERFGTRSLKQALAPSIALAKKGFVVDKTFRNQTLDNKARFAAFPDTAELFLPGGDAPKVGSRFRNPDLARTLTSIADRGPHAFYRGTLARQIAKVVQSPLKDPASTLPAPAGTLTAKDLAGYRVRNQKPTRVSYRGLDVYGMAPSSSGGTSVGEALNILETYRLGDGKRLGRSLHLYLEASARAFADRAARVGDPKFVRVPTASLLSQKFADSRRCTIDDRHTSTRPVASGVIGARTCGTVVAQDKPDTENVSTTHLSVVDRWGNAAAYTLTIEQTGGSGMTVPRRGFLLNNELTDFTTAYDPADPNRLAPGKRPRSSMAPTIVLDGDRVKYVVGSPGGATIITTVLQVLVNRIDLGMTMPEAVAAPRASQRNTASTSAEPEFIAAYQKLLAPFGQQLTPSGDTFTSAAEIGAAATIEVGKDGRQTAVAEPKRRGGGTALVVKPR